MKIHVLFRVSAALCVGTIATLLSFGARAADVENAHVLEFSISKSHGNYAFVRLDKTPSPPIGCASSGGNWHYTLPLTSEIDKKLFSLLMTAHATGKQISVAGSGVCAEFPSIESMVGVRLWSQP